MILYISNYGDINSGWAIAAQECIRALSTQTKVVPRRFKFAPQNLPPDIAQLEQSTDKCKVCIQQCLPHMMSYDGDYYNVGVCFLESNSLGATGWAQYLNLMDEIWTFSNQSKQAMESGGVTKPIKVFTLPINNDMLFKVQPFNMKEQCQGDFLFYTILDFNKRKNLTGILKAFHTEFAHWEPVNLVIKTNALEKQVEEFCSNIKSGLKLQNQYKREVIISGYLAEDQVIALHKSCDVFVLPSHGEGWSIPTQMALCLGKTPIVTNGSSFVDYINDTNGWLVNTTEVNCFNSTSIPDLHTGWETWDEPDIAHLRKCMREAYENSEERQKKSLKGMKDGFNFNYNDIGQQMYEQISQYL